VKHLQKFTKKFPAKLPTEYTDQFLNWSIFGRHATNNILGLTNIYVRRSSYSSCSILYTAVI